MFRDLYQLKHAVLILEVFFADDDNNALAPTDALHKRANKALVVEAVLVADGGATILQRLVELIDDFLALPTPGLGDENFFLDASFPEVSWRGHQLRSAQSSLLFAVRLVFRQQGFLGRKFG